MVNPSLDGLDARLQVRVVTPHYEHGACADVVSRAAILIHGRTLSGTPTFDLQHTGPEGSLSIAEALARAGVAAYVPNLLGYGTSSQFARLMIRTTRACPASPAAPAQRSFRGAM